MIPRKAEWFCNLADLKSADPGKGSRLEDAHVSSAAAELQLQLETSLELQRQNLTAARTIIPIYQCCKNPVEERRILRKERRVRLSAG